MNMNQNQNGAFYAPPYAGTGNPFPAGQGAPAYIPQPKPPVEPASRTDIVFCFLYLAVSFLIIDWALFGLFRLGFTLCYAVMFAVTLVYLCLSKPRARLTPFTVITGLLSLAAAGIPAVFCHWGVNFLSVVSVLILYAITVGGIAQADLFSSGGIGVIGNMAIFYLVRPFYHLVDSFSSIRAAHPGRKTVLRYILLGLLLSVPLLCIVLPLLNRADAAFELVFSKMFGNLGKWFGRLLLALVIFPFIYALLWGVVHKKKLSDAPAGRKTGCQIMPSAVSVTLLCVLGVFYLIYLFSQLAYFTDAFQGVFPQDYDNTVAAYAKRGFFETIAISAINLTVVALIALFTKREGRKRLPASVLLPVFFITAFSLFLLASAAFKMYIYMDCYGLTRLRVSASVFLLFVLIAWIAAVIRLLAPGFPFMRMVIVACFAIGIAVGYADIDRVVVSYNISAWQSGQLRELDLAMTEEMSDSIVPQLIGLLDSEDETVRQNAAVALRQRFHHYYELVPDDTRWCDGSGYYDTDGNRVATPSREEFIPYEETLRFTGYNRSEQTAKRLLWENYDRFRDAFHRIDPQEETVSWEENFPPQEYSHGPIV